MVFLYPSMLYALFLVLIPIIIHLFQFRRYKTEYFSDIRFISSIINTNKSRSKIKKLLLLLSRILAIIMLVVAFAQPIIPEKDTIIDTNKKSVAVYIDNSFSMESIYENSSLIDYAKNIAKNIVSPYNNEDNFILITNNDYQSNLNKEEFIEYVNNDLNYSSHFKTISEILKIQNAAFLQVQNKTNISYIISDFQKTIVDIDSLKINKNINVNFIPLKAQNQNNLFVKKCEFNKPYRRINEYEELKVVIENLSEEDYKNIPVKLYINNEQKAMASIAVKSKDTTQVNLKFINSKEGMQNGYIEIKDYPITFDDKLYISFTCYENISVLNIFQDAENEYIKSLFKVDSAFKYSSISYDKIDYSKLSTYNLIILDNINLINSGLEQELIKFIANGGSVLINPSEKVDISSYNKFFIKTNCNLFSKYVEQPTEINYINYSNSIFKEVFEELPNKIDYPKINSYYSVNANKKANYDDLINMVGSAKFLTKYRYNSGSIYVFSAPLVKNNTNYVEHSLMAITLMRIAFNSQISKPLYYNIGEDNIINLSAKADNEMNFIQIINSNKVNITQNINKIGNDYKILLDTKIDEAGIYKLCYNKDTLEGVALNFNRKESVLEYYNTSELLNKITDNNLNIKTLDVSKKDLEYEITKRISGTDLWQIFILLALMFFIIEALIIRFLE